MHYSTIKPFDTANGPGVRISVFVSGCELRCRGCFNSETWDFNNGQLWTNKVEDDVLEKSKNPYITGLTILGGEPLHPRNIETVASLALRWKNTHGSEKDIWMYTGYTWDAITRMARSPRYYEELNKIISSVKILVDGPFVEKKYDPNLAFRGSSNQRLLHLPSMFVTGWPQDVSDMYDNKGQ